MPEPVEVSQVEEDTGIEYPDWVSNPPIEEGLIYGVGSGVDHSTALHDSVMDITWQLKSRVSIMILENSDGGEEIEDAVSLDLDRQLAMAAEWEAENIADFQASDSEVWVLSSMPIGNALDITQSVLISYSYELAMNEKEIAEQVSSIERQTAVNRMTR